MKNWKWVVLGPIMLIVLAIIFFAVFPLILETQPETANATNITEYTALEPIVDLSPLLIFIGGLVTVVGAVWAAMNPEKARRTWDDWKGKFSGQRPWNS